MRNELARTIFRLGYSYSMYLLVSELVLITLKCPAVSFEAMAVQGALFIGSYFIRCRVTRVWPLILYTAVCGIGIWFLPEIMAQKLLLLGLDLGLLGMGIRHVAAGGTLPEAQEIPWPSMLLGFLSVGAGIYYEHPQLVSLAVILSLINIIFFLLILYADSTGQYLHSNKNVHGLPIKKMLRINTLIVAGIFLVMLVGIGLGELLGLPDAVTEFFRSVGELLKALFYGFVLLAKWVANIITGKMDDQVSSARANLFNQLQKTNAGSGIILTILKFVVLAFLLYFLVKILTRVLKVLLAKYQQNGKDEVIRGVKEEERERLKDRGLAYRVRTYFTMEERARRIYRRRILEAAGETAPHENETTRDIMNRLQAEKGVNLPELTALYEAVRYGGVKVDQEYLRRMKTADMPRK